MHSIASTIAVVGFAVTANAFPAFRGNTNRAFTTFNMFEKASPAVFDNSPLFSMSEGGIQQEAEIKIDINYANGTSIPSDQIKVDITYDDETVGVTDVTETTEAPQETSAVTDDEEVTTSADDEEITTPAPEEKDDEEMTEETAFILSESNNRKLQEDVEVVGVLPPVIPPPVAPLPGLPPLPILPPLIVVDVDYDDDEETITTEAPEEPITEDTDDEEVVTTEAPEEVVTILPRPFRPIIDIITRKPTTSAPLPSSTVEPTTTVQPTTRRPLFPFTTSTTLPPTIIVVEDPSNVEVIIEPKEEPTAEEPTEPVENSFARFLPSWLRPSHA